MSPCTQVPPLLAEYLLTWDGIHLRAVTPASIATTASRNAAAQARRYCAQAIPIVIQSRFHRLRPKTSGPQSRARSSLSVVIHVVSWPPRFLRQWAGGSGLMTPRMISPAEIEQRARTNEVDAEDAPEAELKGGVDDEARHTGYDFGDGDSHCRRPPGDVDPLRAAARSRNRKARSS